MCVRTKKAKITSVDDCFRIGFSCEVIEGRMVATDIGDAEDPAMSRAELYGLSVDLM
jgi:uncharacterized membrane protein